MNQLPVQPSNDTGARSRSALREPVLCAFGLESEAMKQLLSGVTMIALLAVLTPTWAQAPADPPSPTAAASQAPVASDPGAGAAVPGASDRAQPRPKRHVQSPRRHTRYVWDPRWRSP